MRKSSTINLVLLGGGMLAASACVCGGCFGGPDETPARPQPTGPDEGDRDPLWYDAAGNPVPEEWTVDENGNQVPVEQPYDRSGRPMRFDPDGNRLLWAAAGAAAGAAVTNYGYRRGWFPWSGGRGGYRSPPGGTSTGGSRPSTGTAPKSPSTGGSVGRGGFGGSGAAAS